MLCLNSTNFLSSIPSFEEESNNFFSCEGQSCNENSEEYINQQKIIKDDLISNQEPQNNSDHNKSAFGYRKRLPSRRRNHVVKLRIANSPVYLHMGEYEDGSLGEIWIDMFRSGTAMRSVLDGFAIAISLGLQYGVPLEEFIDAFKDMHFEPSGKVQNHEIIKEASSILDVIVRELEFVYLNSET